MQIFENQNFGKIRTTIEDSQPWFVAADVCKALGLDDTSKAVSRLDDDERGATSIRTLGGDQEMTIVSESGLYALILGSRKKEAKSFKRWVTHDVIPAIRKRGMYATPQTVEHALSERNLIYPSLPTGANSRNFCCFSYR